MNKLTIAIPIPPPSLDPNGLPRTRMGALGRERAKKKYRGDCLASSLSAMGGRDAPLWRRAKVDVVWYRPKGGQQRDPQNIIAHLKHAIDGIQDAGVVVNDKGVEWGAISQPFDRDDPRVELTFTEIQDAT